jgi:hypothetical protein
MTMATATAPAPAGMGHNKGPVDLAEEVREHLAKNYQDFNLKVSGLLNEARVLPKKIEDDKAHNASVEIVKKLREELKAAEAARKEEKEPHLARGRAVDEFFGDIKGRLDKAIDVLLGRIRVYLDAKAEAERIAREKTAEAERKRAQEAQTKAAIEAAKAENAKQLAKAMKHTANAQQLQAQANVAAQQAARAEAAAQAKPADLARTRTSAGTSTLRSEWMFEITNIGEIDLEVLRPYLARTEIEKAIRLYIRAGGRELKGARIFESTSAVVR